MRIQLKNVRLSYANVWEPRAMNEGQPPKYSAALLMDPNTKEGKKNLEALDDAITKVYEEAIPTKFEGKRPTNWRYPVYEGDEEKGEAYEGMMYVNAKSNTRPGIVDRRADPILDQSEVYSGCYANVSVTLYAYNNAGNKGVGVGLGNIQKLKDGESLGGNIKAENEFSVIEDDDEDFLD